MNLGDQFCKGLREQEFCKRKRQNEAISTTPAGITYDSRGPLRTMSAICRACLACLLFAAFAFQVGCGGGGSNAGSGGSYSTNFPLTENPISEGDRWINGKTTGRDWNNLETVAGQTFGVGPAIEAPYSDPTAVLTGTWGSNQQATATAYCSGCSDTYFEEIELRLNTRIAPGSITGYEINCRTPSNSSAYFAIVRWNGALGNFTILGTITGSGCNNGDVLSATNINGLITEYLDRNPVLQVSDTTYQNGSPGIGFNSNNYNSYVDYGISQFSATDSPVSPAPKVPNAP
jgi:hypothetical protein